MDLLEMGTNLLKEQLGEAEAEAPLKSTQHLADFLNQNPATLIWAQ